LKTKNACQYLSFSPDTLRKLVIDGVLPFIQIGRHWWFDVADLDAYVNKTKRQY
jgi:excisionase family DNA binding protein